MLVRTLCLNRNQTGYIIRKSLSQDSVWTSWIQSSILHTIYVTFITIPGAHLRQDLLGGQCPIKFSNQKHAEFLIYSTHLQSYSVSTSDTFYLTHLYQVKEDQKYIYTYAYECLCVCVWDTVRQRGREGGERERILSSEKGNQI
jgi:hypothetical protein